MVINDILSALFQAASAYPPFFLPLTSPANSPWTLKTLRNILNRSEKGNREDSTQGYRQCRLVQIFLFLLRSLETKDALVAILVHESGLSSSSKEYWRETLCEFNYYAVTVGSRKKVEGSVSYQGCLRRKAKIGSCFGCTVGLNLLTYSN